MSKVKSQIEKIQYIEDLPVFKIQKNSKFIPAFSTKNYRFLNFEIATYLFLASKKLM